MNTNGPGVQLRAPMVQAGAWRKATTVSTPASARATATEKTENTTIKSTLVS